MLFLIFMRVICNPTWDYLSVSNICCSFPSVCASSISSAHNDVRFNFARYLPSDAVTVLVIILLFCLKKGSVVMITFFWLPFRWICQFIGNFAVYIDKWAYIMYLLLMWFCIPSFELLTQSNNTNGFASHFSSHLWKETKKIPTLFLCERSCNISNKPWKMLAWKSAFAAGTLQCA